MFQSFTRKILRVVVVLYVFARLTACELEVAIEPIDINATIDIIIALELLNECDARIVGFAFWLDSTYEGADIICAEEPTDTCMIWLSPDCGVAIEPVEEGYCIFPMISGCAFNDMMEDRPDAE